MTTIFLSESTMVLIGRSVVDVCRILHTDVASFLPLVTNTERYDKMINELFQQCGDLNGKKILEVGSGYSVMLTHARLNYGLDVYGVEPPEKDFEGRYEIAQAVLKDNGLESERVTSGVGENIPFKDGSFDVVFSFQVFEHVQDPLKVLRESWRVLKPGGILYINAPNYNTFFEGHYNVFWIPNIPKWLGRVYLRLLGRDPVYINHINFLTERSLRKWLEVVTGKQVDSDFGVNDWAERMIAIRTAKFTNPNITKLVSMANRMGLLHLLVSMGKLFKWQDVFRVKVVKE